MTFIAYLLLAFCTGLFVLTVVLWHITCESHGDLDMERRRRAIAERDNEQLRDQFARHPNCKCGLLPVLDEPHVALYGDGRMRIHGFEELVQSAIDEDQR